jgi:Tol biopolymer transport system component
VPCAAGATAPDWAPDGSRILFRSNEGLDESRSQFYTVRPDGTQLRQLTDFAAGTKLFKATYSPDGRQIVVGQGDAEKRGDLWAMTPTGPTSIRSSTRRSGTAPPRGVLRRSEGRS